MTTFNDWLNRTRLVEELGEDTVQVLEAWIDDKITAAQECSHSNTANHFDNPRRFFCLGCRTSFVDYGSGYQPVPGPIRS